MNIKTKLVLYWTLILESVVFSHPDCVYNESLVEHGRKCRKPCTNDAQCHSNKKRCMCDGPCGMSCFNNQADCNEPENIANGRVNREHTLWKAKAYYSCDEGYLLVGDDVRTCHSDKKWYPDPPVCKGICSRPRDEQHSFSTGGGDRYVEGKSYSFICKTGYYMTGKNSTRTCLHNLTWSQLRYRCNVQVCAYVETIRHGTVVYSFGERPVFGTTATLKCNEGYREETPGLSMRCYPGGDNSRYGEWRGHLSSCLIKKCPRPVEPINGRITNINTIRFQYGAGIMYECNEGYKLNGPVMVRCDANGDWGSDAEKCLVDPDCDFENYNAPTCGFDNVQNRWMVRDSSDGIRGRFIRSNARSSYLIAKKIPENWTNQTKICLEFDYRITHKNNFISVSRAARPFDRFWRSHTNEETNVWLDALVDLDFNEGVHFRFEASYSNIDLDKVVLSKRPCENHCQNSPCDNGGTCVNRKKTFSCFCTQGFEGSTCDIDMKCPEIPEKITNGLLGSSRPSLYLPGKSVYYKCNNGCKFSRQRVAISKLKVTCVKETRQSRWNIDVQHLACEAVTCMPPVPGINQGISPNNIQWKAGDDVIYTCVEGFFMLSDRSHTTTTTRRTCQLNGTWSGSPPNCDRKFCTFDGNDMLTPIVIYPQDKYEVGINIRIKCKDGYKLIPNTPILECSQQMIWQPPRPRCERITCGPVPKVYKDVSYQYPKTLNPEKTFTYRGCDHMYAMLDTPTVRCQTDGTYTRPPTCTRLGKAGSCGPAPNTPENAIFHEERSNKLVKRYTCTKMYRLIGSGSVACDWSTGQWTTPPKCEELYPTAWTRYNGIQYLLYSQDSLHSNYDDAQNLCRSIGGELAILYNREVRNALQTTLSGIRRNLSIRVGYKKKGWKMNFQWDYDRQSNSHLPSRWQTRDDDWSLSGTTGSGNCAAIESSGFRRFRWKKVQCDHTYPILCQRNDKICKPNPCRNGGTCNERNGDCLCLPNFSGGSCQFETTCDPAQLEQMIITGGKDRYSAGSSVSVRCLDGYQLNGSSKVTCGSDGQWISTMDGSPRCTEITCPQPSLPETVRLRSRYIRFKAGKYYNVVCENGYKLVGDSKLYCGWYGQWTKTVQTCEEIVCKRPILPAKAIIIRNRQKYGTGSWLTIGCIPGYSLSGSPYVSCGRDGQWKPTDVKCIPRSEPVIEVTSTAAIRLPTTPPRELFCGIPPLPANTRILGNQNKIKYSVNTRIEVECKRGYSGTGNGHFSCRRNGQWSLGTNPIQCTPIHSTQAPDQTTAITETTLHKVDHCVLDKYLLRSKVFVQGFEKNLLHQQKILIGEIITLTCNGSVEHDDDINIEPNLTCGEGGKWIPYPTMFRCVTHCVLDQYLLPSKISVQGYEKHQLRQRKFPFGKILTLTCRGSVVHVDDESTQSIIKCSKGGTWIPYPTMFRCANN